jgi:hypothetical protein
MKNVVTAYDCGLHEDGLQFCGLHGLIVGLHVFGAQVVFGLQIDGAHDAA